jgi:hypothetical protein
VADAVRLDAIGWRQVDTLGFAPDMPLFTIDYGLASQLWYNLQRPVYTSWGQYRLWGIPAFDEAQIVALRYVDPELVSLRLREMFAHVDGPDVVQIGEGEETKLWRVWRARGLHADMGTFLDRMDLLNLARGEK